jgi:hypothetical protein
VEPRQQPARAAAEIDALAAKVRGQELAVEEPEPDLKPEP